VGELALDLHRGQAADGDRKGRVSHPNAWSQAPHWETNHLVSHVAIESNAGGEIVVRSRFHMMELRRDVIRHFGGRYGTRWCATPPAR
jgi:3-phenylpropionate/cinnamic acid dioxygenase small subunit